MVALPSRAAPAQQAPQPPPITVGRDEPLSPEALVARDLEQLRNNLTRSAPPTQPGEEIRIQQQREESARRLLSRQSPAARDVLLQVLKDRTSSPEGKLATARAIADAADPDPRFAADLLPLLGSKAPLQDAVTRALARYGDRPEVRQALTAFAQDTKQPAAQRGAAIRALSNVVDRSVADALYALLTDARQPAPVQNAASDALADLAGQQRNGHDVQQDVQRDVQRWKQWHDANAPKADVVWRADVLAARDAHAVLSSREQSEQIAEQQAILDERLQSSDQAGKDEMVNRLLNSPVARVRAFGLAKVQEALNNATKYPVEAPARVRELIGDNDPRVRLAAGQAINQLNDPGALGAVLTQLPQETDPDVKASLAEALVRMSNPQAVPALRGLLGDPSIKVATSAAKALKNLGPKVREQSEALAGQVANELWTVARKRAAEPGGAEFQARCLEAIGQLHARPMATNLLGLLNPNEPETVRGAALRALGDLGESQATFQISTWLDQEPSADNRVDAIDALGHTSSFEDIASKLYERLNPAKETSEKVRDRAWLVFQGLLPAAKIKDLNQWASNLKDDPAHQKMVLLALNDRLLHNFLDEKLSREKREDSEQNLALSRQNTGAVYMKLGDPAEAAILFSKALEYWQKKGEPNQTTEQLVTQQLNALLAAKHYTQAAQFASDEIGGDPRQQTIIRRSIRGYIEPLVEAGKNNDPEKLRDAAKLIAEIGKMKNPLDQRFRDDLAELKKEIDRRLPAGS
ncbi:MAG: repeat protein [Phycisphaerales bacterium]|nr:repeat protein [Phycisphaerales bacterium]